MGYHVREINKGTLGELSKVQEELDEARDAWAQGNRVLVLNELSDILGAVEHFLEAYRFNVTLEDLIKMARATKRAFEDGSRK